jgi:uncharacterized membrane protein YhaH (DUF805 family)
MTQAATFGRRGAATPPARTGQLRPTARPAPSAPRAAPAPQAAPKSGERTLLGYFLWLLFGFSGRLDRRTYRYTRIVANGCFVLCIWSMKSFQLSRGPTTQDIIGSLLLFIFMLLALMTVMAWTTLAMQVKRRHDRDKGWPWLLVGFIPIVGPIWVLVETCWLDGTPGYNRFDDPKKMAAATFA